MAITIIYKKYIGDIHKVVFYFSLYNLDALHSSVLLCLCCFCMVCHLFLVARQYSNDQCVLKSLGQWFTEYC